MDRQVADGEHDDDDDEHLGRLAARAQLQLDGRVRVDREQVLVAARHAAAAAVVVVARLLRDESGCSSDKGHGVSAR